MIHVLPTMLVMLGLLAAEPLPPATCSTVAPTLPEPEPAMAAAACLMAAGRWPEAALHYHRVSAEFPDHPLAEEALLVLFGHHEATGDFAAAAGYAETYAARYHRRVPAIELLFTASVLRRGLGQPEQALADLDRLEATYARPVPSAAARAHWARRELLTSDDERVAHAEQHLRRYGKFLALDQRIVVEAGIAEIEWSRSCEKGSVAEFCIRIHRRLANSSDGGRVRDRAEMLKRHDRPKRVPPRPRCPYISPGITTIFPRDPRLARSAQRRFATIVRMATGLALPEDPQRRQALADAITMARIFLADQRLEQFLLDDFPDDLEFRVDETLGLDRRYRHKLAGQRRKRADSQRRLTAHMNHTVQEAESLESAYTEAVRADRGSVWAVAAALRIAWINEHRADELRSASIPRGEEAWDRRGAYCEGVEQQTASLHTRAIKAYASCLELARTGGAGHGFMMACEEALAHEDARAWPVTSEMFGEAIYTASRPVTDGLQPFVTASHHGRSDELARRRRATSP